MLPWLKLLAKKKWDGDGVPLEESNCAGIGSDEDKSVRKAAASTEPAWSGLGGGPMQRCWRIEQFQVKPWADGGDKLWGNFFDGDSYIVYEAAIENDLLVHRVYIWLGSKTTADEKGTAAYKMVELDDLLDGAPTQNREVQGSESFQFKNLFRHITYQSGGIETGFHHVGRVAYVAKFFRVRKTKTGTRVEEVEKSVSSMNKGDCFILDSVPNIYVWFGENCSPFERSAAGTYAENLESQRDGHAHAEFNIDAKFWEELGGGDDSVVAGQGADKVPEPEFGEGILMKLSDSSGALSCAEIARGDLKKAMLDSSEVMILDLMAEVFIWVGTGASAGESRNAYCTISKYLKMNGRSPNTPITMLKEGAEKNPVWNQIFSD